ncbi:ATP-dependent protease [Clostridia bacterium]|nr:ATP-dependent protease [Clostridia bacterium]
MYFGTSTISVQNGFNASLIKVEVSDNGPGVGIEIVGMAGASLQESKSRILTASRHLIIGIPKRKVIVNLLPASEKKTGSTYDLAIFAGMLGMFFSVGSAIADYMFYGEIAFSGDLCPVNGCLSAALKAKEAKCRALFVPAANAREAAVVEGITVYGVANLTELVHHLFGERELAPVKPYDIGSDENAFSDFGGNDFRYVKGHYEAKKAIEVAVAGFHNVLMLGSAGTGKSMLAKCIPSIMPRMTFTEMLEVTQIHSIAGTLDRDSPIMKTRPFRNISHNSTMVSLQGGQNRPGEISLAHRGVLFMDELPEFSESVIDSLRVPLETGVAVVSRAAMKCEYPCNFMLVAAMNPCKCGNYGSRNRPCTCTANMVRRYLGKLSRPFLDRIDIQIEVPQIPYEMMAKKSKTQTSFEMRQRVIRARQIQEERFKGTRIHFNSQITPEYIDDLCRVSSSARDLIGQLFQKLNISSRAHDKIIKLARTIADLSEKDDVDVACVAEAVRYHTLERKYWDRQV